MEQNSFNGHIKGVNRDIANNLRDDNAYWDATNFLLRKSSSNNTVGDLENLLGDTEIFRFPDIPLGYRGISTRFVQGSDLRVVGGIRMSDWLVLFTTDNPTVSEDGLSQIWLFKYNAETKQVLSNTGLLPINSLLILDEHLVYNNKIKLSQKHPIRDIKARYENETIGRIVWCDGNNFIGNINVLNPDLYNLNPSLLYINSEVNFSKPLITGVSNTGGSIPIFSRVLILYKLVDSSNKETNFSPISNAVIVPPGNPNDYHDYLRKFTSNINSLTNTGSVNFEIRDLDTNYKFIKLYAIVYNQVNTNLEFVNYRAFLFNTLEIANTISGVFTNQEPTLEEISAQEINTINFNASVIPQSIEINNNRIVALNNKRNNIVFDFDTRCYRFKSDGSTTLQSITEGINTLTYTSGNLNDFFNSVPEKHDAINPDNYKGFNDVELFEHKFQANGTTLGGEGLNLKYEFVFSKEDYYNQTMFNNIINNPSAIFTYNQTNRTLNNHVNQNQAIVTNEFNINSPITHSFLKGFMPNEIYRFGLVARDFSGNVSFVNWIGDIRIPEYFLCRAGANSKQTSQVGIKFTFKNKLPDNIKSVEFVYVERTLLNKTVLDFSTLNNVTQSGSTFNVSLGPSGGTSTLIRTLYTPITQFNSRLIDTNFKLKKVANEIRNINNLTLGFDSGRNRVRIITHIANSSTNVNVSLANVVRLSGGFSEPNNNIINILPYAGGEFRNAEIINSSDVNQYRSIFGSGFLFTLNSDFSRGIYMMFKESNKYGGEGFQNRANNSYITTGCFLKADLIEIGNSFDVYGGDTVSILRVFSTGTFSRQNSNIREFNISIQPSYTDLPFWFRDFVPTETDSWGSLPTRSEFTYIQAFNQIVNPQLIYFNKPNRFIENNNFPHEIIVSNRKTDGELTDSWSRFDANNIKNVNGIYGPIVKGVNYKNQLIFLQERAIGVQQIDERVQTVDNAGQLLGVGTGAILPKEDYISTEIGCYHPFSVVSLESGLYFFSGVRRNFYKFSEGAIPLDVVTGLSSEFDRLTRGLLERTDDHFGNKYISAAYDTVNRLVRITFSNGKETTTWCYDEVNQVFVGKIKSEPLLYINTDYDLFTIDKYNQSGSAIVLQNFGEVNRFREVVYPSEVVYLFKENAEINKIINYIEFQTQYNNDLNIEDLGVTFDKLEISTIRDTTEVIDLSGNRRLIKRFNKFAYDRIRTNLVTGVGIKRLISGTYFFIRLRISFDKIPNKKFVTTGLLTNYSIAPV